VAFATCHAAAMIGVMLPFIDVDIVGPIDVDVVVAPIATAAPIIAPIGPASMDTTAPKGSHHIMAPRKFEKSC
jgi:hypothetical protein